MRIDCPICGARDRREFSYKGDAKDLHRPSREAGADAWDDYLHTRENPCGPARELWHHGDGCGAWLIVTRNTLTHEMIDCTLVQKVRA